MNSITYPARALSWYLFLRLRVVVGYVATNVDNILLPVALLLHHHIYTVSAVYSNNAQQ